MTKPVGEWNHVRILVNGAHVEHWLNGEKIVTYELWSGDWNARVAKSKFKDKSKFGTFERGPICLQDHSDRAEFRNIKLRALPGAKWVRTSGSRLRLATSTSTLARENGLRARGHAVSTEWCGDSRRSVPAAASRTATFGLKTPAHRLSTGQRYAVLQLRRP